MRSRFIWGIVVLTPALVSAGEPPAPLPAVPNDRLVLPGTPLPPIGSAALPRAILPSPRLLPDSQDGLPPSLAPELQRGIEQLRKEREALSAERTNYTPQERLTEPLSSVEEMRLQVRLIELHAKLKAHQVTKTTPPLPPPERPATPTVKVVPASPHVETPSSSPPPGVEMGKASDPLTLAQAQFRAGEYSAALQNYRRIDPEDLTPREKVLIQYMTACCLRKLAKLEDAAVLYREVANAREDEVLTDCALWQLNLLNGRRELEKQLEELRRRREMLK